MTVKSLPIVVVDWMDADTATDGWKSRDKVAAEGVKTVHTVGFLVSDTKDRVIVVGDYDPTDDNANGGSIIPRGMIKRMTRIGTWKPGKEATAK